MARVLPHLAQRLARLTRARFGLRVPDASAASLVERLDRHLAAAAFVGGAEELIATLEHSAPTDDQAWGLLFRLVSTNVTGFFRDPAQFALIERELLAPIAAGRKPAPPKGLRLWSAGCSIGCEAYSLAMICRDALPPTTLRDLRILATDLSPQALEVAERGVYDVCDFDPLPERLRRRHVVQVEDAPDGCAALCDRVRSLVRFRRLNLMDPWPFRGRFDAILVRNVLIHFDAAARATVVRRLVERLRPGGLLVVGAAETLADLRLGLTPLMPGAYRR